MRGEYWIIDGTAHYCDGDVGDVNHEGYALDHVRRTVADKMGVEFDEMDDWQRTLEDMASDRLDPDNDADLEAWNDGDYESLIDYSWEECGITPEEWAVANDRPGIGAREYAIKHLGWKRVIGSEVETWTLTQDDIQDILDGAYDTGEADEDTELTIYVFSTKRTISATLAELRNPARRPSVDTDIANRAAMQYTRNRDLASMPSCYKHIGD